MTRETIFDDKIKEMFSSPKFSRKSMDLLTTKRLLDEKCQTIEQLKNLIDELKFRHEKKEQELIKHIGILYNDLQQNKKKMAHFIFKYQKQKQFNESIKILKDFSTQTEETYSTYYHQPKAHFTPMKISEQHPKYYTLQSNNNQRYISATSPSLSTVTDRKHNESSSSAYNTAESLPSSTYSDEIQSLERVLNAACTMYTTHDNLEHTIKLQEELFRQRLRLRGIHLNEPKEETASEHFYDNIDSETSDIEKQTRGYRTRSVPWYQKKQRMVRFSLNNDQQQKTKTISNKVKFSEPYYPIGKRKNVKPPALKINLAKFTKNKKNCSQHANINHKKIIPSNMLTVTIT